MAPEWRWQSVRDSDLMEVQADHAAPAGTRRREKDHVPQLTPWKAERKDPDGRE
jgi:hypothetical protein